ncbi:MAG: helix-turn-helix domain-containing protein [Alphaproteobacteria bacterium]
MATQKPKKDLKENKKEELSSEGYVGAEALDRNEVETPAPEKEKKNIGLIMRETRLEKNFSIADVVESLRIRKNYINAIEDGRFEDLPGMAYAIGFIRSYSDFLELDTKEMIASFKSDMQTTDTNKIQTTALPSTITEDRFPIKIIMGAATILLLISLILWYTLGGNDTKTEDPIEPFTPAGEETLDQTLENVLPEDTSSLIDLSETNTEEPAKEKPKEINVPQETVPTPITTTTQPVTMKETQITAPLVPRPPKKAPQKQLAQSYTTAGIAVYAEDDSWLEIRDTNKKKLLGRLLKKGETYYVPNLPGLTLKAGNAGALRITMGDKEVPRIGKVGKVVSNVSIDEIKQKAYAASFAPENTPSEN